MEVKNIAECSKGSILQYFRPSLSYHLSLRSLLCLFLSGRLRQALMCTYIYIRVENRCALSYRPSLVLVWKRLPWLCCIWTTNVQTSLRKRAVWSAPLLFAIWKRRRDISKQCSLECLLTECSKYEKYHPTTLKTKMDCSNLYEWEIPFGLNGFKNWMNMKLSKWQEISLGRHVPYLNYHFRLYTFTIENCFKEWYLSEHAFCADIRYDGMHKGKY